MYQGLVDLLSAGFSSTGLSSKILSCVVWSGTAVSWAAAGGETSAIPMRIGPSRSVIRNLRPCIRWMALRILAEGLAAAGTRQRARARPILAGREERA